MGLPKHTKKYLEARAPLLRRLEESCAPFWKHYLAGHISHAQYRELIEPFWREYRRDIDSHWRKAGGSPDWVAKQSPTARL